jgi:hypothetical protein
VKELTVNFLFFKKIDNAAETEELFVLFHKACSPAKELNAETFNSVFPSFKKDYRIQKSLFDVMDKDGGKHHFF